MAADEKRYEHNREARRRDNERRLCGETLDAFHRRENTKPPTLAEIYRDFPRAVCPWTPDLFEKE